jgi:hypothetical protein
MGDKSPKSKQKNQSQKQSKNDAASKVKQKNIDRKQQQGISLASKKK